MRAIILFVMVSVSWAQQAETLVDVAARRAQDGDTAGAVRLLETVVQARPEDARAWGLLGNLLNAQERYAEGAEALRKATELDPGATRAKFDLGVSCFHLGQIDKSREFFEWVLAVSPQDPDALWMRGQVALRERDLDRAITCFHAASEAPETRYRGAGRLHEGLALAWKGEQDRAVAAFRAAAEAEPEGAAGLLASLLAGRLGDGPSETVLRPEDYVAREGGCDVRVLDATSLDVDEAGRLARYRVGTDLALGVERHAAPLLPHAMVRLVGLAAIQASDWRQEARFVVRADLVDANRVRMFLLAPAAGAPSGAIAPYAEACDVAWKAAAIAMEFERRGLPLEEEFLDACGEPLREAMQREWWNDLLEAIAREEEDAGASGGGHAARAALIRRLAAAARSSAGPSQATIDGYGDAAEAAVVQGQLSLASTLYRMRLTHLPDDFGASVGRLRAQAALGRPEAALRAAEGGGEGLDLLAGRSLFLLGRIEEAVARLETHVEAHADSSAGWRLLGLCHAWSGQWAEAERCLRTSLSPGVPGGSLTRFYLGYAAWFLGDAQRAREEWAACAKESPGSFHGILAVGLSTLRAASTTSAGAEKLRATWRPLARVRGVELGRIAGAFMEWLDAAQPLGLTQAAFESSLTPDLKARCGAASAVAFLEEALSQAEEDAAASPGEESAARLAVLRLMKQALSASPR